MIVLFIVIFYVESLASHNYSGQFTVIGQDSTEQDTVLIKSDSLQYGFLDEITKEDSTLFDTPWQMPEAFIIQLFPEEFGDLLLYFPGVYLVDQGNSMQELFWTRHGSNSKQTAIFWMADHFTILSRENSISIFFLLDSQKRLNLNKDSRPA